MDFSNLKFIHFSIVDLPKYNINGGYINGVFSKLILHLWEGFFKIFFICLNKWWIFFVKYIDRYFSKIIIKEQRSAFALIADFSKLHF